MDPTVELSQLPEITANALDLGLVGLALVVLYKGLGIVSTVVLAKRGYTPKGESPHMTPLACQVDPRHFERIKELHRMTKDTEKQKAEGAFKCQWQGRDEIRDLLETLRALKTSVDLLTSTIRNGGGAGGP